MTFECDDQVVHKVCWTGSPRWGKDKPARNDTVHLWMGMSPNTHFMLTAGRIPALLNSLSIFKDAASSMTGLFVFVQMCAEGPIRQTTGKVVVEKRYQPLMHTLHTMESPVVSPFSATEPQILSLYG